jgi:hypothetical protein
LKRLSTYIVVGEPLVKLSLAVRLPGALVLAADGLFEDGHVGGSLEDDFVHVICGVAELVECLIERKCPDTGIDQELGIRRIEQRSSKLKVTHRLRLKTMTFFSLTFSGVGSLSMRRDMMVWDWLDISKAQETIDFWSIRV